MHIIPVFLNVYLKLVPHCTFYSTARNLYSFTLFPQAVECLQSAIRHNRHDTSFVQLAKVYLYQEDISSAIEVYKQAVE